MTSTSETSTSRDVSRYELWERYWHDLPTGTGVAIWDSPASINAGMHMRLFKPYFDPSLPVLDVGCGNGTQTAFLSSYYDRVVGLEIADSAVRAAAEAHQDPRLAFRRFDVLSESDTQAVRDEFGDCNVYIRTLLHLFDNEGQRAGIANIARLMGNSGSLFIAEMPSSAGPVFEAGLNAGEESLPKVRHNLSYGIVGANLAEGELVTLLEEAGIRALSSGRTEMQSTDQTSDGTRLDIPLEYAIGRKHHPEVSGSSDTVSPGVDVVLGDDSLTTDAVAQFARTSPSAASVRIAEHAAARMAASVAVRNGLIATHRPIYGVTTGFGDNAQFHLSPAKTAQLQRSLITYHLNGTGPLAPPDVVRATMLVRVNCLARGYSGIRQGVVDLLAECLRHGITPLIPERGSVGASGDLVPLCYLADMLTGSGDVLVEGGRSSAAEAFRRFGLEPVTFEAKEGLALINGTSFMSGFGVLAAHDAKTLSVTADVCTALAAEALLGNRGHFHPLIHQQKPHPGQVRSAERIRELLSGSGLCVDTPQVLDANPEVDKHGVVTLQRHVQDRYSIRCAPHVNGVLADTLDWVTNWLNVEINSTNDNPLFDAETSDVYSGGNFYGGHVGQAMDALKLAVASVGDILDRQLAMMVDTKFSYGLPPNLAPPVVDPDDPVSGLNHGFKGMQIACSALAAEALKLTNPATAFSRSTEAHNQDKVSMGTIAARDARTVVELVREIAAIHLLASCQAVDLRGADELGAGTWAVYQLIRDHVPFVQHDRQLDMDLATVVDLIRSGAVSDAISVATTVKGSHGDLRRPRRDRNGQPDDRAVDDR